MGRTRAITLLVSTLFALVGVVAPAGSASAAPCTRTGCNGKMAATVGCTTGAYAIGFFDRVDGNDPDGKVKHGELWYSPDCGAMWGEYHTEWTNDTASIRLNWQPTYGGMTQTAAAIKVSGAGYYITTMFSWEYSLQLCGAVRFDFPEDDTCTRWR